MAEFSRRLSLGLVGPAGRSETVSADAAERAAVAERLGILGIETLSATFALNPEADGSVLARGRLAARVTQACVVTLEPVGQAVEEDFALRFLPPGRAPADGPEEIDSIETEPGGIADLGEAMAQQLALALDPYPRVAVAELPAAVREQPAGRFAALAAWKRDIQ